MTPIFAPIVSFVTTSTLLAKSQFLLAAAWVQSQALFAATAFAGAALGVQLAIAAAALLAVIFVTVSIYKVYKHLAKKAEDGEEVPDDQLQNGTPEQKKILDNLIVQLEFECPIGVELMEDPVIASDGKTYDRKHITDFFNNGANNISPLTRSPFANHDLKPNKKRKAEIDGYLKLKNEGNSVDEIIQYLKILSLNPAVPPQGAAPAAGSEVKEADELEGAPAPEFYEPEPVDEPPVDEPADEAQPDNNDDDMPDRKSRYGCRRQPCIIPCIIC